MEQIMLADFFIQNKLFTGGLVSFFSAILISYILRIYFKRFFEKFEFVFTLPKLNFKIDFFNKIKQPQGSSKGEGKKFPTLGDYNVSGPLGNILNIFKWAGFGIALAQFKKILICFAIILFLLLVFTPAKFALFFFLFLVVVFTSILLKANKNKRRCIESLPDAIDILIQSLKAGYSFAGAVALVERETRAPVSNIFGAMKRASDYHIPFVDSMTKINEQITMPEWRIVGDGFIIKERVGGNIIPMLQEMSKALRQRITIENEIKTSTASGRLSGIIIATLAPLSFVFFYFFNEEYISIMTSTIMGKMLLTGAFTMEAIGFMIIWKITKIEL